MINTEGFENFTVLENEAIGKNISMYRKMRGIKALDIAERIGMKEAAYTKYERGETNITIDFVQKVAEVLKVDPLQILSVSPTSWDLAPVKMPIASAERRIFSFTELKNTITFKGLPGLLADVLPDKYGNTLINAWLSKNGRPSDSMNPVEMLCFIGKRGMGLPVRLNRRLRQGGNGLSPDGKRSRN